MRIFYGAGHEQFKPSELLRHAQLAEGVGSTGSRAATVFPGRVFLGFGSGESLNESPSVSTGRVAPSSSS